MTKQCKMNLPFVRVRGNSIDYWATAEESGDWAEDNRLGRSYADALVAGCGADELGLVLSHVARAITAERRYGGIEVGFFNRLGEIASFARGGLQQAA